MQITKKIKQQFQVSFNFDLLFTKCVFDVNNATLLAILKKQSGVSKAVVVIDDGVAKAHPSLKKEVQHYFKTHQQLISCLDVLTLQGGETLKNNDKAYQLVLKSVNQHGIDRHSYVIAIGGGAFLDAVGFAAATAHRGVRLIRIPTTVLSQNDSGVGVKNGINYFGKKNFLGCFATPYAIVNDEHFLTTLDDRNWRSGTSEAVKVALIKDLTFFKWIENNAHQLAKRDAKAMNYLIYRCAALHIEHIGTSGDAFEQGSSRPLDFGHWAAHKLEQLTNYKLLHGEAVAIGIALDCTYSFLNNDITEAENKRVLNCLLDLGFEIYTPYLNEQVIVGLNEFREHLGGQLTIMLLKKLGKGYEVHQMEEAYLYKAMDYLSNYSQK